MMSSTIAQPVRDDIQPYDTAQISHRRVASSGASSELVATLDEFENQSGDEEFEHTVQDEDDADDAASVQSLDSLLDGVIEIAELTDEALATYKGEPEVCTLEEATAFRAQLRAIGPEAFCKETIYSGKITARKLITAFGLQPPQFYQNETDDAFYRLLGLAISRELSKRIKLQQYNSLDDAVELIKKSKNIIVLTGAGISTSLGIPDFRSKGTGIYSRLKDVMTEYGLTDPQEVFDIRLFREHPEVFFRVAAEILVTIDKCSPTHTFIAMLQNQGKLLTNYSQNIDNIEAIAGILPEKIVQCHGSFATASCTTCKYQVDGTDVVKTIKAGVIPRCDQCKNRLRPASMKRKRSANGRDKKRARNGWGGSDSSEEDYDDPEPKNGEGIMKPDITFFGEPLPDTFSKRLTTHDKFLVDLVIVIGTSLKVAPVSEVVPYLPAHVPQMYISRDPVSHVNFDIDLLGDCDIVVAELCRRAGWDLKHEMAVPKDQEIEVNSVGSRHYFKITKPEVPKE